jgi:antitoxin component of MazEF toxin-antitoxin module
MVSELKTMVIKPILGNSTFILILPKDFVVELKVNDEDHVKCHIESDRIIFERADVSSK